MAKVKNFSIAGRTLKMAGLKPSDYFLFKQEREYFDMDMRELVVLGLRWVYAGWHDPVMREMIKTLAIGVKKDNLDVQVERIEYKEFGKI